MALNGGSVRIQAKDTDERHINDGWLVQEQAGDDVQIENQHGIHKLSRRIEGIALVVWFAWCTWIHLAYLVSLREF